MTPVFAMFGIGPMEWAIIGILGVLLFGGRLPDMAKNLGRALPSFKRGMVEVENEITELKTTVKKELS